MLGIWILVARLAFHITGPKRLLGMYTRRFIDDRIQLQTPSFLRLFDFHCVLKKNFVFNHICFLFFIFKALDVLQFARDAHLADEWISQNELVVKGKDGAVRLF